MKKTKRQRDVPAIRFPGFTDSWEQRKLGEVAEFNPKCSLPEVFKYVDLESVVGTEMINEKITSKAEAPSRAQRLAQIGDLFFQTVRPYQKNNYLFEKTDKEYVFSTGYAQLRPRINGYFLLTSVQTEVFVKAVLNRCTGTSYTSINSSDLSELKICIPMNNEESVVVGNYFRSIDNLITLQERKCRVLRELKKCMLQKMFPKNGSDIPEIRFPGFTDSWEQRKLLDYADFYSGNGLSWNDISDDGQEECILYGNLYTEYGMIADKIVYRTNATIKNPVYSKFGDVLIPASDTTPTGLARATSIEKSGVLLGGDINIVRPKDKINGSCLSLAINANKKELIKFIKGTSVRHIHNADIKTIEIPMPQNNAEQEKLVNYFKNLDNLITLQERKCKVLRELKKCMLQKMFV